MWADGQRQQADEHLTMAAMAYRGLGVAHWLEQALGEQSLERRR
jgi:hypothetical protein